MKRLAACGMGGAIVMLLSVGIVHAVQPNDPYFIQGKQWYLTTIQAPQAWDIGKGNATDRIAVIDNWNGTDQCGHYHRDLWAKQDPGWDRFPPDSNMRMSSGMWNAGLAGAATDNAIGMAGLGWNNRLVPIRAAEPTYIIGADFAEGIRQAVNRGAQVLTVCPEEWGMDRWNEENPDVSSALTDAKNSGRVLVGEAGSDVLWIWDPPRAMYWPGRDDRVLCVGGTDISDRRIVGAFWDHGMTEWVYQSYYGNRLDVVAPGGKDYRDYLGNPHGCWTTHDGNQYAGYNDYWVNPYQDGYGDWWARDYYGTRGSAALVAGLAGLLLQKYGTYAASWKHDQIANIIRASADDQVGGGDPEDTPGWDQYKGFGRINAYRALSMKIDHWTWDPNATAFNNGRKLVYDSNWKLHMVWCVGDQILYANSTDHGQTWTSDYEVSQPYANSDNKYPAIALDSQNRILVVWQRRHTTAPGETYYVHGRRRETNGTWSSIGEWGFSNAPTTPSVAINGTTASVVWRGINNFTQYYPSIRHKSFSITSIPNYGTDIGNEIHTPVSRSCFLPCVVYGSIGRWQVVWRADTTIGGTTYSKIFQNHSASWVKRVLNAAGNADRPTLIGTSPLYAAWNKTDDNTIYWTISNNNGDNWAGAQQAAGPNAYNPSIIDAGANIPEIFYSARPTSTNPCWEIYRTRPGGGGPQPVQVSNTTTNSMNPSVAFKNEALGNTMRVACVWMDLYTQAEGSGYAKPAMPPWGIMTYGAQENKENPTFQGGPQGSELAEVLPTTYEMGFGYPNPFTDKVTIIYALPKASDVNLSVYDATGKLIRVLTLEAKSPGRHTAIWDGKDNAGRQAAKGVYFYRINAGEFTKSGSVTLIR